MENQETKAEPKKMPERKKTFKIKDNSYDCEFFNTGQLLEVELLKTQLSRGQYNELSNAGTVSSNYSRFMVDCIATLTVLIPSLKKDMNVKTISELKVEDSKYILQIYLKEIFPWVQSWMDFLNSDDEQVEAPKDEK